MAGKNIGLAFSLVLAVCMYVHAVDSITDTFVLEGGIEVTVEIDGDDGLLTIEASITNNTADRLMVDRYFLGRYPLYLADENGKRGALVRPPNSPRLIVNPASVSPADIDILEQGETKLYCKQYEFEQTANRFVLSYYYLDEPFIENVFENPQTVKITVGYHSIEADIAVMMQTHSDIPIMPDFSRTYTLAEFGQ